MGIRESAQRVRPTRPVVSQSPCSHLADLRAKLGAALVRLFAGRCPERHDRPRNVRSVIPLQAVADFTGGQVIFGIVFAAAGDRKYVVDLPLLSIVRELVELPTNVADVPCPVEDSLKFYRVEAWPPLLDYHSSPLIS